ncbi:hypothetical protein HG536_0B05850 [Torulaspora globosa]|uniref:Protein YIP n=1 Tax=Torulaspora globosa TaxID=48254 RepID=A0A7G3ZDY3_9SACH|nr:uncharacterized protein HG536_0B05850 [Torulaspora globosa]QLL31719.1 hypothetical protein HG536_0B05850 [Torulaspora globosa]
MSGNADSYNRRDSFTELDDGLEGVDDFTHEPNPFDDVISDDYDAKKKPPGYGNVADTVSLPPGYEETMEVPQRPAEGPSSNQAAAGTLPPGLFNYLSQYFELDDQELKKRLYSAIAFKLESIADLENRAPDDAKPDLYSPVWIFGTIVMTNFIGSRLFEVIVNGVIRGVYWQEDSNKVFGGARFIRSFWLYLIYGFLVPLVIAKTYLHRKDSVAELISTYGYSLLVWIPLGLLIDLSNAFQTLLPKYVLSLIKWVFVTIAFMKSSLFLYRKMNTEDESDQLVKWPVIGLNAIMCIVARFLLYHS